MRYYNSFRFEENLFQYFARLRKLQAAQPLMLGGVTGSGGGTGGPPGGFIGMLPQTRVTYDLSEDETLDVPTSGASLLDNLNHIRYRIANVEASISGIRIKEDDVLVASGITVIDFADNFNVEDEGGGEVRITVTMPSGGANIVSSGVYVSGIHNEDLTSQIGVSETHFTINNALLPGTLELYYNGIRQRDDFYTIDPDYLGFTTTFTVYSGDSVLVDYDTASIITVSGNGLGITDHGQLSGLGDDDHLQYLTDARAGLTYATISYVDALVSGFIDYEFFENKGDLVVATGISSPAVFPIGSNNQILVVDDTTDWGVDWKTRYISQQIVFTIEGANLAAADEGVKPLKIYIHDVGDTCEITEIYCALGTAPTAANLQVDIMKNGNSIFDTEKYVEITTGSMTASKTSDFLDDTLEKDDYLQIELVQGDSTAANLTVHIRFRWEL